LELMWRLRRRVLLHFGVRGEQPDFGLAVATLGCHLDFVQLVEALENGTRAGSLLLAWSGRRVAVLRDGCSVLNGFIWFRPTESARCRQSLWLATRPCSRAGCELPSGGSIGTPSRFHLRVGPRHCRWPGLFGGPTGDGPGIDFGRRWSSTGFVGCFRAANGRYGSSNLVFRDHPRRMSAVIQRS
jgi:hypothetical protein